MVLAGCGGGSAAGAGSSSNPSRPTARPTVVASDLANPRQLTVAADGAIYVAEAGDGGRSDCAKPAGQAAAVCIGDTGSIARIADRRTVPVITGLPSVASAGGQEASGPADVVAVDGRLAFVIQDTDLFASGANQFGRLGKPLGHLALAATNGTGGFRLGADLARYEATHDPDRGAAADSRIESDPYGLVAYRGGYVVADAAANDLLGVDKSGAVRVIAVLPTQTETTSSGTVVAQSVPTSVAVGPDGALYVGELTGAPFKVGAARIWRVVPGHPPTVYATGFTDVSAIAFDHRGRLLVLEIDRLGLTDTSGSGELIRVTTEGRRAVLLTHGLVSPTGVAVGPDGSIYISNYGSSPSTGAGPHGEILRLAPG
ncbi:MAG TPA: ScyD/ScyE family protein [Solirubrobacteraceae bacterium]|nr:ScyD/ScyE family protein [Solirubrobacteraceae bacterium]